MSDQNQSGRTPFFAIVGPCPAIKRELYVNLQQCPELSGFRFVTDSGEHVGEHIDPITKTITALGKNGSITDDVSQIVQLLLFWTRLANIIHRDVEPYLAQGTPVIMIGFGGSVLAHAVARAKTQRKRDALHKLHLAIVEQCVYGMGITPPEYLYCKIDDASQRLVHHCSNNEIELRNIAFWNAFFQEYGKLPGQKVIQISTSGTPQEVLERTLEHILTEFQKFKLR